MMTTRGKGGNRVVPIAMKRVTLQADGRHLRVDCASRRSGEILRSVPAAAGVRDNWGPESFAVRLRTDPDTANLSGLTDLHVAASSAAAMSGHRVAVLHDGEDQIPIVARLRVEERAQLSDIRSLYVYASQG